MASKAKEVEATVIEPCDHLEITKATPGSVVESNISAVKAYVDSELAKYAEFEVTDEDGYKAAKAQRTEVRKLKGAVDAERKRVKQAYEAPLKDFEAQVKTITGPIDELESAMKGRISEYEESWRQKRVDALEAYYAELAPALADGLVPFARILDPAWLNRSAKAGSAEQGITEAVQRIATDDHTIDGLDLSDEERTSLKADYFSSLDLSDALARAKGRREQRERVEGLEEMRGGRDEPKEAPMPEEVPICPQEVAPCPVGSPWVVVVPCATRDQMGSVAAALRGVGVTGTICHGTVAEVYGRGSI